MCSAKILWLVFLFTFNFFNAAHFHFAGCSCWRLAFLIFSPPLLNFHQQNFSPLFSSTCSSSFSVIHVSVDIKNNIKKDSTLLFFLSKSPGGRAISCQKNP